MSNHNIILRNKIILVNALLDWAETFREELDEDDEPTSNSFDFLVELSKKLENETCDEKDYSEIMFHLWQINYNEEKIIIN